MSKPKHTPGPWRLHIDTNSALTARHSVTIVSENPREDEIRTVFTVGSYLPEEPKYERATANAQLASAAPELLEALKALRDDGFSPYTLPPENFHESRERYLRAIDQARAAIAKPEGRSE